MGWIRHHAIVVTAFDDNINEIHSKAKEIFPTVSKILKSRTNGYTSIFIPPDGSKEGWETSNLFDDKRDEFIAYLQDKDCKFVEIAYGECDPTITRDDDNE